MAPWRVCVFDVVEDCGLLHWHCRFRTCGGRYACRPGTVPFLVPFVVILGGSFVAVALAWLFV